MNLRWVFTCKITVCELSMPANCVCGLANGVSQQIKIKSLWLLGCDIFARVRHSRWFYTFLFLYVCYVNVYQQMYIVGIVRPLSLFCNHSLFCIINELNHFESIWAVNWLSCSCLRFSWSRANYNALVVFAQNWVNRFHRQVCNCECKHQFFHILVWLESVSIISFRQTNI